MKLGRVRVGVALGLTLPLFGCAAVGPNYVRPAAIVSAQYKEIKGWKAASPHDDFAKGDWWKVFRDAELDRLEAQVAISNQTLKADEANYREALALIAEARAALSNAHVVMHLSDGARFPSFAIAAMSAGVQLTGHCS